MAGNVLKVDVLNHVIMGHTEVSRRGYVSLREMAISTKCRNRQRHLLTTPSVERLAAFCLPASKGWCLSSIVKPYTLRFMKMLAVLVFCVEITRADGPIGPVIGPGAVDAVARQYRQQEAAARARADEEARDKEHSAWLGVSGRMVESVTENLDSASFRRLRGKVLESHAKGVRVSLSFNNKTVFIANTPGAYADDDGIDCYAKYVGLYRYTTVQGALATIEKYDWGTSVEAPKPTEAELAAARARAAQAALDRARATIALNARTVIYQHQQASNGLPSFQFELGKRYLNGGWRGEESQPRAALAGQRLHQS